MPTTTTAPESIKYTAPQPFPGANTASAPQVDSGIVGAAMNGLTPINTAANVSTVDGSKYNSQQATGYTAAQGQATNWNVDDKQTVSGQINRLIAEDSPLMQQAATGAKQTAAKRGLVNSTMAVQAGQAAVYDKATPIAQADASTHASAAKSNQDAANSFSQFNASAKNQAAQFGAAAKNTLQSQKIDVGSRADITNAGARNDAAARDAQLNSQQQITQFDGTLKVAMQNADAASKLQLQQLDGALKFAMQNADAASKLQLQQMDGEVRTTLSNIEATYKNQMQTSQSMAASYQSMIDNITRIMMDKDMDAAAKQDAINKQTSLYNNALQMQSQISGLELGSLLSPEEFSTPPPEPWRAPEPQWRQPQWGDPDFSGGI